ncbi:MAG: asparagine synthase (glutamine-hydrolyzing) [Ignavibacteriae bacterium]|nr:asparagine synthase (glutamine-hydrolyzing) [Ignavibacteriota bacterium]
MCGICGIYSFNDSLPDANKVQSMMSVMKHRGPDNEAIWNDDKACVGFVRLSVIDLSPEANQPMADDTGRYVITFNGEIYNYIELKEELILKGHSFKTKTDSEVLLKGYIEWGADVLNKSNGMFAFVIYDTNEKKLFAARDRYGVKPFYYHFDNNRFIFSSEINPIVTIFPELNGVNDESVYNYLVFNRTDYNDDTFYSGIKRLPHGSYMVVDKNVNILKWYNLKDRIINITSDYHITELLESSIKLRLRSDVPIGLCLSGGLDSSAIASILINKFNNTGISTFSAVYPNYINDESNYINEYSNVLKNMFYVTPDAQSLFADKENFVKAQGEPLPSTSPYAQYKVMQLASGKVKVTLDGQGADEELAGYHYFFGNYYKELFGRFKYLKLLKELLYYFRNHKSLYGFKTFIFFLLSSERQTQLRVNKYGYLSEHLNNTYSKNNFITSNLYSSTDLNEALYNHFEYKLEHLLKWEDRNSMNFSIEARLPFLDFRLVEYVLGLPSDQKISNGQTKYILREEMKGILPENIRKRQSKVGFDTPEDEWFREPYFKEYISDIISSSEFKNLNYFNIEQVRRLYKKHLNNEINASKEIWKWINMYIWMNNNQLR